MQKQFRQRPIDIARSLPIHIGDLPDDEQFEEYEPEDQEAFVPIPEVKEAESKVKDLGEQGESTFVRPSTYIKYFQSFEEENKEILYDMDDEDLEFSSKYGINAIEFEYLMDQFERETSFSPDLVEWHELPQHVTKYVNARLVYQFWRDKRYSRICKYYPRCGRPLLTNYEIPPDPNDTSPFQVFRPREDKPPKRKKNEPEHLMKMDQLKNDFVHLLSILDHIKQREQVSKNLIETTLLLNKKQEQPTDVPLEEFMTICKSNSKPIFGFLMQCTQGWRFGRNGRMIQEF